MLTTSGPTALTQQLTDGGHLPPDWRDPFACVDRALFLPDRIWIRSHDGYRPVDRTSDPEQWQQMAYSDTALVTQVEDPPGTEPARTPSSSASMPRIVATMLQALQIADGQRILEIGAGTGYNAALLSARLGDQHVTTIEVNPDLAEQARDSLKTAGFEPDVVTGDGAQGWAPGAPYDRVIATCAVHNVPPAWLEQTAPGGLIILPWGTALRNGVLLQLTVQHCPDGPEASGPVIGDSAFMWMQAQAPQRDVMAVVRNQSEGTGSRTRLDPSFLSDDDAWFAAGILAPNCQWTVGHGPDGEWTLWLADSGTGSWASVDYEPDATEYDVQQHGPRQLWDELERAHAWWMAVGKPARTRFGLTVTPTGQHVWLDQPDNPVPMRG